jgi:hypothetical protein
MQNHWKMSYGGFLFIFVFVPIKLYGKYTHTQQKNVAGVALFVL